MILCIFNYIFFLKLLFRKFGIVKNCTVLGVKMFSLKSCWRFYINDILQVWPNSKLGNTNRQTKLLFGPNHRPTFSPTETLCHQVLPGRQGNWPAVTTVTGCCRQNWRKKVMAASEFVKASLLNFVMNFFIKLIIINIYIPCTKFCAIKSRQSKNINILATGWLVDSGQLLAIIETHLLAWPCTFHCMIIPIINLTWNKTA